MHISSKTIGTKAANEEAEGAEVIRWVRNVSLWLLLSGLLVMMFDLLKHQFHTGAEGAAIGLFLVGLVGLIWSGARERKLSKHNQ